MAAQPQPIMALPIPTVLPGGILTMTTTITAHHHHRLSPDRLENPVHPIDLNPRGANQNQGPGGENQTAPKAFHYSADQFAGGNMGSTT